MTLEEVEKRIAEIRGSAMDDERAHSLEDQLRVDFLRWLAEHPRPVVITHQLAQPVLSTERIDFARHCS